MSMEGGLDAKGVEARGARFWLPGVLLAAAVLVVYGQTAFFGFVSYDDPAYVSENPYINAGVTWAGVKEVVLHGHDLLWTPITSVSYMVGCNLFGLNAGMHHATNVLLHIVAALLVFYTLWRYTGSYVFAWAVAFVFALHPLNVESVAWVSGRKNQLYAIFWMCSLLAYRRYALAPSLKRYGVVFLLHFAGLASKPTHLMLPAVLLLLDVWPLGRIAPRAVFTVAGLRRVGMLVLEKVPLFALSGAITVWTMRIVAEGGGLRSFDDIPLSMRLPNTAYVYAYFVQKLFWPSNLAVEYPYPHPALPGSVVAVSVGLLAVLAVVALVSLFRGKAVFVGLAWYAAVILPESGLLRANAFLMADRYAYMSTVGLMIAVLWPVLSRPWPKVPLRVAGVAVCGVLGLLSARQCRVWTDDIALFSQSVAANPQGSSGHNGLGTAFKAAGRMDEAIAEFEKSVACPGPFKVLANMNLGTIYFDRGDLEKAAAYFENVAEHNPAYVPGLMWAARTREKRGDTAGALTLLDRAAVASPGEPNVVKALNGRVPDRARGYTDWAAAMVRIDRSDAALPLYEQALALEPAKPEALLGAWSAAMNLNDPARAEGYVERYLAVKPEVAMAWGAKAISCEELGRLDEARAAVERALQLDPQQPQALDVKERLK